MCGICGFVDFRKRTSEEVLRKMTSTLYHRGPDDTGVKTYVHEKTNAGFGHTRLSILDISDGGHQPMNFKHLDIVFNGEIYNFKEVKADLFILGHLFYSESDTEVILHAYEEWGKHCVERFIGMFVFAIIDNEKQELIIIRDRAGVKPIFYYWKDGLFLFASELKAFHQHPDFVKEINEGAVRQYMQYGFVPSPNCIFKDCYKLNPGHLLVLDIAAQKFTINKYWDINDFYRLPKLDISYEEAVKEMEKILVSSFEYRMVADVPVGIFLSGGYDSTAVATLLQNSRRDNPIKTFTIGFKSGNDEAPFARKIANYIGSDHNEYYCTEKEAQDIIPTLPFFYDEPFADSSAIPTMLVSKVAREQVTVALSADGADEVFVGYTYYNILVNNLLVFNKIPRPFRKIVSFLGKMLVKVIPCDKLANKIEVLVHLLNTKDVNIAQVLHHSYFKKITKRIEKSLFLKSFVCDDTGFNSDVSGFRDCLSIALATDYKTYMQNDILTKVDRATMSVSLEGREPFLDHRIVEFAAQLPTEYKFGKTQKLILKDIVHKYVPKSIMDRPKTGFLIPIDNWLRNELAYLLEENLSRERILHSGFFNPNYVEKLKKDFLNNKSDDSELIWKLLQFQMWFNKWM
jgi:asparagine synthase (glutamine-hydrolysing)